MDASDLLSADVLDGLDDLSADELAARARSIPRARLQSNPIKFAGFKANTSTTIGANATEDFVVVPTRNMIVRKITVETSTTANAVGLQVTKVQFGDEAQNIGNGALPGGRFAHDATGEVVLGVLPKGIQSTITVANVTGAPIDDVAVCAEGWCSK